MIPNFPSPEKGKSHSRSRELLPKERKCRNVSFSSYYFRSSFALSCLIMICSLSRRRSFWVSSAVCF